MGVSPWKQNPHHAVSPEGTAENPTLALHVGPLGLGECCAPHSGWVSGAMLHALQRQVQRLSTGVLTG